MTWNSLNTYDNLTTYLKTKSYDDLLVVLTAVMVTYYKQIN